MNLRMSFFLLPLLVLAWAWPAVASENRTSIAVYGGFLTPDDTSDLILGPYRFADQELIAVSLSRELFSVGELFNFSFLDPLKLEAEGVFDYHWGNWPKGKHHQEFVELIGSFNLRWHRFPWNNTVLTTIGIGDGVSYTPVIPTYELHLNNTSTYTLNYLMVDVTLAHPKFPQLAFLLRWHHRSGIFGLIDDVHGGSDFFTAGLKYSF